MEWRLRGVRRWVPVLLLVSFLVGAVSRLAAQADGSPWRVSDVIGLVVNLAGVVVGAVAVLIAWRSRTTLGATGLELRGGRRKFVAYDDVGRVYRDRFTSGVVTLLLKDDTKVVLPAPVAGLGVASPAVDEAVEQIRARLPLT